MAFTTNVVSQSAPKKSWADIVKGRSAAKVEPLRPAARGTHRCMCTGEFLVMLGHYGWIMALQDIDHPEADRHGGRIYLKATDLRPGASPKEGEEVTFFLYADDNGLGAEDCYATNNPHPPQPPQAPVKKQVYSRPKVNRRVPPVSTQNKKGMNAAAHEFVPIVLVPLDTEDVKPPMNPEAKNFVPAPPGLGPTLSAEASEFVPFTPLASRRGMDMYCAINTKRFYDDDDSSDDGTESTASDISGNVLVAPGLSTCFVSKEGRSEQWSTLSSRCAQAVVEADADSDSWCDDDSDDEALSSSNSNRAEEWAAVSARCAQAVGKVEHQEHPWRVRNAVAAAKSKANVGNDIRWDVVLDTLAELDGTPSCLPPGLAPPGLSHPSMAPPGLAFQ